ncbi:alpha-glycosidase [Clostridium sp. MCC353]|uniref:glycoside hydrolase family 13 protein n=1 Tax=Clostridium sp. MCC353 TaxID=2592646 RepID=UPI001C01F028|nr:glycoside hydrolase family 13 protein [Clostridium sp. MCC353]MBT9779895.1 alpha-glycosidase [Clostridium sp. MCC353]
MDNHKNAINRRALFCDETEDYRMPPEPDEGQLVRLRFRTARNDADRVCYIEPDNYIETEMIKYDADQLFDYYQTWIDAGSVPKNYFFQVMKGMEVCYYNRLGATADIQSCFSFRITPGFHTPEWAKGAVMYQIFVDRFNRGDISNDVESCEYIYIGRPVSRVEDWKKNPSSMDVGCFYGGDLQGVWDKLDYLQYLGVEVIYFNPIFVSPSNHKYDCQDYDYIDPHYGVIVKDGGELVEENSPNNDKATKYMIRSADKENLEASNEFFARFVEEVHKRGMKVIIDGVFNHCGSFNKWLDRERIYERQGSYEPGAYISKDSPYRTFFKFYNDEAWPYNGNYDGWWGHSTLPKLNYEESPKLYEYIMKIARKWVSPPYSVDGWRLDVAADLGHTSETNHQFWRDFRNTVKEANPNAIILAEHYGDPSSWLQGDQWDTVMNYDAFMEPVTWFLTGMEKHSDEYNGSLFGDGQSFFRSMNYHMSRMQTPSLQVAMNELSNHDHSRFLTRTNRTVGRIGTAGPDAASVGINYGVFREAVMIQMTWPGAPTLYYGDEAGVCGWTDPDNRRTFPWGEENFELIEYHRYMIAIHKRSMALKKGSVKELAADRQLIAYGRSYKREKCVVVINNSASERHVEIPVWEIGVTDEMSMMRVVLTTEKGYNVGQLAVEVKDGVIGLEMPGNSGILLMSENDRG